MSFSKLWAIAISGTILAAQVWAIFPPGNAWKSYYWPFMDYPMYASSKAKGEVFRLHQLRIRKCGSDEPAVPAHHADLYMTRFRFMHALRALAAAPEAAQHSPRARRLSALLLAKVDPAVCSAEVWEQAYPSDVNWLRTPRPAWVRRVGWDVPQAAAEAEAGR